MSECVSELERRWHLLLDDEGPACEVRCKGLVEVLVFSVKWLVFGD